MADPVSRASGDPAEEAAEGDTGASVSRDDERRFHGRLGVGRRWPLPRCVSEAEAEGLVARPGYGDSQSSLEFLDSPSVLRAKVAVLASLMRTASNGVVYTGAGVSTASGIGDYASRAQTSVAPHRVAEQSRVQAQSRSRLDLEPTYCHQALAALSDKNHFVHWLQQNHDRLAQKVRETTQKRLSWLLPKLLFLVSRLTPRFRTVTLSTKRLVFLRSTSTKSTALGAITKTPCSG
jgi:hypothetical protein